MPRPLRHDPARQVACPHCGEAVRRDARSCRHCGSDAATGWGDHEDDAEVELPEAMDDRDHEAFVAGDPEVARHAEGPSAAVLRRRRRALYAIVLALLLLAAGALARGQEAAKSARDELLALVKPFAEATSYRFDYSAQTRRVRPGSDPSQPPRESVRGLYSWTIDFEEGKPQRFVNGKDELWRSKTQFALLHPVRKKWFAIARVHGDLSNAMRGSGEVAQMFGQANDLVLPHLLMAGLATRISAVEKRMAEGRTLYVATLTRDGARDFVGDADEEGVKFEKEPPAFDPASLAGTLTITVVDGAIAEIASKVSRLVEKSRATLETNRSFKLSAIGTLALEVPAHITAVLRAE